MDLLLCDIRGMLRGNDDRLQARRLAVLVILDRNLRLSVRTKILQRAVLADLRQAKRQTLR